MSDDPSKGAPRAPENALTHESDPADLWPGNPQIDPTAFIILPGSRLLLPREMPRCVIYMHGLSGEPIPLNLWECKGWGTAEGIEIVQTHDGHWALGDRDERVFEKILHSAGEWLPAR